MKAPEVVYCTSMHVKLYHYLYASNNSKSKDKCQLLSLISKGKIGSYIN